MAKLRINGDTSGYVDITVPAVAGERTLDVVNPSFAGSVTARDTVNLINTAAATGTEWTSISNYSDGNFVIARRNDDGSYRGNVLVGWADGSTGLATGNNGTERLRIDTSGRVTMPYQPAFDVSQSAGSQPTGKQSYNTVYTNIGSCFNTTNSRFTAPVSGTYIFFTTIIKNANASGVARLQLYKNGSVIQGLRQLRLTEGVTYATNGVGSWIVTLSANDYIEVYNTGDVGSYGTNEYQYFNGYLIG